MRTIGRSASLFALFLALISALPTTSAAAQPLPVERTLAVQLLELERKHRTVPEGSAALLRQVLTDAYAAAGRPKPPRNEAEFRAFASSVSTSFARHNFIQPVLPKDWVESLGHAFEPIAKDDPRVKAYLDHPQNRERRPLVDRSKPFHFVDCDMAALLIISVAQMAGFDVDLVHAPRHNFVRWRAGGDRFVNWDWTHWGSHDDLFYRQNFGVSQAQVNRGVHLTSHDLAAARGYFIIAMARKVPNVARKLELRRLAAPLSANEPVTASNVGWAFATTRQGVTPEERRDALSYGLTGWASAPDDPVHMNVVACALAARHEFSLARAIQEKALEGASPDNRERYAAELGQIRRGELC